MYSLPKQQSVYMNGDSSEDDSITLTEYDKYLITKFSKIHKSSNNKRPTYHEIKRKLINSLRDFKLKKDKCSKLIIKAFIQELFQTTKSIEAESQLWTPASITNQCEDNEEKADEFGNLNCVHDGIYNLPIIPVASLRNNSEKRETTANIINLPDTNNKTKEDIECIIKSTEQFMGKDFEESIECFKIFKSAPKLEKSFEIIEEKTELIDLTHTEVMLDEDKKGLTHQEDNMKRIQLVAEQESKRNLKAVFKEKWKTEKGNDEDNKISEQCLTIVRDTSQQKIKNEVTNKCNKLDDFISMKWEMNGDELYIRKMESFDSSKRVFGPEHIKDKKPHCFNKKKVMNDKDNPFYIDRNLVSVGVYQEGLMYYQWNPTQVLYEICMQSQWTNPLFSKIAYSVNEGFLFSVQVNNEEFIGEWSRMIKTAKHSASTTFLQFLGFEFEVGPTLVFSRNQTSAHKHGTRIRKFEDYHGLKNQLYHRECINQNYRESWSHSHYSKNYHNCVRIRSTHSVHSYQPYSFRQRKHFTMDLL